jgi:hypothetical protein
VTYTAAGNCVIDANQAGTGSYADAPQVQRTITVSKIRQSISFTAPASGAAWSSAGLSATGGGSGNPVVFSVDRTSGPRVCRMSGTTVTYTAAGNCVIDANQAGTGSYAAAPQVQRTIRVIVVPQYTGVSSLSQLWGGCCLPCRQDGFGVLGCRETRACVTPVIVADAPEVW